MKWYPKNLYLHQPVIISGLLSLLMTALSFYFQQYDMVAFYAIQIFSASAIYFYLVKHKSIVLVSCIRFMTELLVIFIVVTGIFLEERTQSSFSFFIMVAISLVITFYDNRDYRYKVNRNDFKKHTGVDPDLFIYLNLDLASVKGRFSFSTYIYLFNGEMFDNKGLFDGSYSFDRIKSYLEDNFRTFSSFSSQDRNLLEIEDFK